MAQWKERINISKLHRLYENGVIGLNKLSKGIATKLRKTSYHIAGNVEMITIIEELMELTDTNTIDDYDVALDMLYDFGDEDRKLWIETEINETSDDDDDRTSVSTSGSSSSDYMDSTSNHLRGHSHYPPGYTSKSSSTTSTSTTLPKNNKNKGSWDNNTPSLTTFELDKKLNELGISREKISYDTMEYIRKAPEESQDWLLKLLPMSRKPIKQQEETNGQ